MRFSPGLAAASLCALCWCWCGQAARAADATDTPTNAAAAALQEILLDVTINGQKVADAVLLLRGADGRLYVRQPDMQAWRLLLPSAVARRHLGETYLPLDAIAGLTWTLDEPTQSLIVQAPAQAFQGSESAQGQQAGPLPARADQGGFFNYDLFSQRTQGAGPSQNSGLFELGFFKGDYGVGVGSFLARDTDTGKRFVRLDTTWTKDDPQTRTSLRFGDSINRPAATWGRSARFGGIQYATNFSTQPYFISFPLQSVAGEAVLPSTVDVFVNNALASSKEVPPGPFAIRDLPTITGGGAMRVVVRDLLGREQVITQPFYASASLLRNGVDDFSYEAGFTRESFGQASNDYGRWLAAGTYRRGLSEQFTAEVHVEAVQGGQATLGLAGTYLQPLIGVFNVAGAASRSDKGSGQLLALGFERNVVGELSFGARNQWASSGFTQIGQAANEIAPRRVSNASVSYSAGRLGAFGLGYVLQDSRSSSRVELLSASYSVSLFGAATLGVSFLKTLSGAPSRSIFAVLTLPLGDRINSSVSMQRSNNAGQRSSELTMQVQQSPPVGEGLGWHMRASDQGSQEVGAVYQTDFGTYSLAAASARGQGLATRAGASGGVAFIGGAAFLGRRISDSFGVVQMPDYPDIRVYADNQPVARIDAKGNAFLPRLRAYEKNPISINQGDLPLDARIDTLTIDAVPYYRSGLVLKFPIERAYGGLLRIVLDDGMPLPAGAIVRIEGQTDEFPVAMEGEAYLTGLKDNNRLRVEWRGQGCDILLTVPPSNDPLPHFGTFACPGVKR